MENIKKRALDYLKSKPELKELYGTEDGFLFEQKYDATTHAKTLNETDPSVLVFQRENKPTERLSPTELKVIKEKKTAEYVEIFGEAPDPKLTASELHKLIEAKKAENTQNTEQ